MFYTSEEIKQEWKSMKVELQKTVAPAKML